MRRTSAVAAFAVLASSVLWGQSASVPLIFEVASIKPSVPDSHADVSGTTPGVSDKMQLAANQITADGVQIQMLSCGLWDWPLEN